ncbi:protein CBFA2T1-like [Lampetra fluviatilis]
MFSAASVAPDGRRGGRSTPASPVDVKPSARLVSPPPPRPARAAPHHRGPPNGARSSHAVGRRPRLRGLPASSGPAPERITTLPVRPQRSFAFSGGRQRLLLARPHVPAGARLHHGRPLLRVVALLLLLLPGAASVPPPPAPLLLPAPPQLPAACGARQLSKLKRFLTTLQQFGSDISAEIGERVRALVLALVNSTISIEDFHSKLQEATNFPLRPFVIPFLKANLPLLQRELMLCARLAKQSPSQYLAQHERLLLEGVPHGGGGGGGESHSPVGAEATDVAVGEVNQNGKRRAMDKMKGAALEGIVASPPDAAVAAVAAKRARVLSPILHRFSPGANGLPAGVRTPTGGLETPGSGGGIGGGNLLHLGHVSTTTNGVAAPSHHHHHHQQQQHQHHHHPQQHLQQQQQQQLHHHQQQQHQQQQQQHHVTSPGVPGSPATVGLRYAADDATREGYGARHHHVADGRESGSERRRALMGLHGARPQDVVDHRLTDREWSEEWKHLDNLLNCLLDMVEKTRRALTVMRRCQESDREELAHWARRYGDSEELRKEEAVNEVKRQAVTELQRAMADSERKAHELIVTERAKMERVLADAKRQALEDAAMIVLQQDDSTESCWNCGRKASETCSGCNSARYCGAFCQHKDWERHHHVCGMAQHKKLSQQQQHHQQQQQQPQQHIPEAMSAEPPSPSISPGPGGGSPASVVKIQSGTPRPATPDGSVVVEPGSC